ncbi:MAG: UvrD-helicase domain-containing protein [Pontiellaceae bacterium]
MNLVYSASAGTGKTYQVTQLYLDKILNDQIDPRDILLMTFTENAATELRTRISAYLHTALQQPEKVNAERIRTVLTQLESAPITTIHGFCTTLLKEHALDAGLSSSFSILAGEQQTEWLESIAHQQLINQLEDDPLFAQFCEGRNLATMGKHGNSIPKTAISLIHQAGSLGILLTDPNALLEPAIDPQNIKAFKDILEQFDRLPKLTTAQTEIAQQLRELLDKSLNTETLIKKIDEIKFKPSRRVKEPAKILADLIEECRTRIQYKIKRPLALGFACYLIAVYDQYNRLKYAKDLLDFDDLQYRAFDLIKNAKYSPSFNTIIIDEVQDTSQIQAHLIQALWKAPTNLIICGDPKQSIYSWRGADPSIMPNLQQSIIEQGGKLEHLQTSWRSKEALIEPINTIFSSIFSNYNQEALKPNKTYAHAHEPHGIECLLPDSDSNSDSQLYTLSKKDRINQEMQALARRIQLLIHGTSDWQPTHRYQDNFQPTSEQNTYRYSDILILMRNSTELATLEQALRKEAIPYTLGGKSRGLFSTTPAHDISLLLNTLCDPTDAFSLIGLLRSPWIGLSDQQIIRNLLPHEHATAEQILHHFPDLESIITQSRKQMATCLASEIIREWIQHTQYDATLAALPQADQQIANIRKLIDWIREQERGMQTNTATVARTLKQYIANPPQVAGALSADPEQNAVTIMTIHSAKGLSKRVVCLPSLSFHRPTDTDFAHLSESDKSPQLSIKIMSTDHSNTSSPHLQQRRQEAQQVRNQESDHLFYVALTRARDLLILSSPVSTKPNANSWHPYIEPLLGQSIKIHRFSEIPQTTIDSAQMRTTPSALKLFQATTAICPPKMQTQFQRTTATAVTKKDPPEHAPHPHPFRSFQTTTRMGTCGHALLEEAAHHNWNINFSERICTLSHRYDLSSAEINHLSSTLPITVEYMKTATQSAEQLLPEYPFLIQKGALLIDGTIDLVVLSTKGIQIYDYKFSQATYSELQERYHEQLHLYAEAIKRLFPTTPILSSHIIAISEQVTQSVPVQTDLII